MELALTFGVGVVVFVVSGDPGLATVVAVVVAGAASVRFVDRHVGFSFGEGFVGYRGDPGWPQGVQEDDDVHWDWRPRAGRGAMDPSIPARSTSQVIRG